VILLDALLSQHYVTPEEGIALTPFLRIEPKEPSGNIVARGQGRDIREKKLGRGTIYLYLIQKSSPITFSATS